jgi:hypothetical protein
MKTISILLAMNKSIMSEFPGSLSQYKEKEVNKANRKIALNNKCVHAPEHGLTEQSAESQMKEVNLKIARLKSGYSDWLKNTPQSEIAKYKSPEQAYLRMMNVPAMKKQVKFLDYILQ